MGDFPLLRSGQRDQEAVPLPAGESRLEIVRKPVDPQFGGGLGHRNDLPPSVKNWHAVQIRRPLEHWRLRLVTSHAQGCSQLSRCFQPSITPAK